MARGTRETPGHPHDLCNNPAIHPAAHGAVGWALSPLRAAETTEVALKAPPENRLKSPTARTSINLQPAHHRRVTAPHFAAKILGPARNHSLHSAVFATRRWWEAFSSRQTRRFAIANTPNSLEGVVQCFPSARIAERLTILPKTALLRSGKVSALCTRRFDTDSQPTRRRQNAPVLPARFRCCARRS